MRRTIGTLGILLMGSRFLVAQSLSVTDGFTSVATYAYKSYAARYDQGTTDYGGGHIFSRTGSVCLCSGMASAQTKAQTKPEETLLLPQLLHPDSEQAQRAIGNRFTVTGAERVVVRGTLVDGSGTRDVALVWQFPGLFRLVEAQGPKRVLLYDESTTRNSKGDIGSAEKRILDSLVTSLPEQIFTQASSQNNEMRSLGGMFRDSADSSPNYAGPFSNLFAIVPAPNNAGSAFMYPGEHFIFFDSKTLLLRKVAHAETEGGAKDVETRFSDWKEVNGQWYPGLITRLRTRQADFAVCRSLLLNAGASRYRLVPELREN